MALARIAGIWLWACRTPQPSLAPPVRGSLRRPPLAAEWQATGTDLRCSMPRACTLLRRMQHQEHMRAVGTHDGPTRILNQLQATPSEGRRSWHHDTTLSAPQLPPGSNPAVPINRRTTGRAELLEDGHRRSYRHCPPEPQDLPRDNGPDGAAGGQRLSNTAASGRQADSFAAYDVRRIDELSGRTTGRLGDIRPDIGQRYRRDGRAGTTILHYSPHSTPDPSTAQ
jgi:hypothetical protein